MLEVQMKVDCALGPRDPRGSAKKPTRGAIPRDRGDPWNGSPDSGDPWADPGTHLDPQEKQGGKSHDLPRALPLGPNFGYPHGIKI
jgi:hypothetical protein